MVSFPVFISEKVHHIQLFSLMLRSFDLVLIFAEVSK